MNFFIGFVICLILYPFIRRGFREFVWDLTNGIVVPGIKIIRKLIFKLKK